MSLCRTSSSVSVAVCAASRAPASALASAAVRATARYASEAAPTAHKVAFVGLGSMGSRLASRIVGPYNGTKVFDASPKAVDAFVDEFSTAQGASSALEALDGADVLVSCLPTSTIVRAVIDDIEAAGGFPREGLIWVDCTSGNPSQTRDLAAELADKGVTFLDCAVSGGPKGAAAGTVAAMVGGDETAFNEVEPIIDTFAGNIVHLGGPGAGHAVKAVNNALLAANLWTASEGLVALTKAGIDPERALDVINTASGRSWVTMQRFPDNILTRKFDYGFSAALHLKDVDTALSLIEDQRCVAPVLGLVRENLFQTMIELGEDADHVSVVKMLERVAGVEVKPFGNKDH